MTSVDFSTFVDQQYKGIPEQTETIEDKKRAIAAKKRILQHPDCPPNKKSEILREISVIEGEIAGMQSEAHNQAMNSSIFPSRNNLG